MKSSRRRFIRGSAGLALTLPWLELPLAADEPGVQVGKSPTAPLRYAHYFFGSGIGTRSDSPWSGRGSGDAFTLSPSLKSLVPFKDQITVLKDIHFWPGTHGSLPDYLSAFRGGSKAARANGMKDGDALTFDQLLADKWGLETELPCLQLGCDGPKLFKPTQAVLSWRVGAAIPRIIDPREAYDALFSGPVQRQRDRSVLDFMREGIKEVHGQAGSADRQRMDQFQTTIREIEQRLDRVDEGRPAGAWKPTLTESDMERPGAKPTDLATYMRLMLDISLLAFRMDKTRVQTFMFTNESSGQQYDFLEGVGKGGYHSISHGGGGRGAHGRVTMFFTKLMGEFLAKAQAVDEGERTLLENSLFHFGSDMDSGGHGGTDLPMLLAGRAGGRLQGGRMLRGDGKQWVGNVNLAIVQKLGLDIASHGLVDKPFAL